MNKYEKAFDVIDTILHLLCGEEREDGYKPSHDEMVNSMENFKELVERAIPKRPYVGGFNPDAGYPESGFYCCPNCCERIAWFDLSNVKRDYKTNHCFYCGQALEWRVEND